MFFFGQNKIRILSIRYLKSVEVYDIQQHEWWHFSIHRWLTFDDEHQLKFHFPSTAPSTKESRRPFVEGFTRNMSQNHLLYSIYYRSVDFRRIFSHNALELNVHLLNYRGINNSYLDHALVILPAFNDYPVF